MAQDSIGIAFVGATVIDGTGAPAIPDAIILIENHRIRAVGPRSLINVPKNFERHDLTGLTVLPGLIDSHVHLSFAIPQGPAAPNADEVLNSSLYEFLRCGVTSVRDLGGSYPWILDLARSVERGERSGPRIFVAGPLLTAPGGHPAGTLLAGNKFAIATATRQIGSAEQGRAVVRELAAGGVDVIKAVLDSRGRSNAPEHLPTFNQQTLSAIVDEAHAVGLPVTVHWGNVEELSAVVAARPTQIEHSGYAPIPDSVIQSIARAGIVVDPTLVIMSASIGSADEFAKGPLDNVRRLHTAGVAITAGTDAPLRKLRFGESLQQELELLVESGLSPMEAIQAATSRPAALLSRAHDIGVIQTGKRADLIAVEGDPLRNISNIRNIRMVVRDGQIMTFASPK